MRAARWLVWPAALLVATGVLVGCSPGHPQLHLSGDSSPQGAGKIDVPVGSILTEMTFNLCATGGDIQIERVRLRRAESIKLVGWATKRVPPVGGDAEHYGQATSAPGFNQKPIV